MHRQDGVMSVSDCRTQVGADAMRGACRRELFTAEGNEFYIFPASRYIHPQETLDFYQLLARGRVRQEVCSPRPLLPAQSLCCIGRAHGRTH